MTKVAICIPHASDYYHAEFMHSYISMQKPADTATIIQGIKPLDEARNQIAAQALANPSITHLLWMDSDLSFRHVPNILNHLMSHQSPIVSALYYGKSFPHSPQAFKASGNGQYLPIMDYPDGLFKADAVGMGFCLVRRDVFEKLKAPYFEYDRAAGLSEDIVFCRKVSEHFDIKVDSALKLFHLRTEAFGEGHFKSARHLIQTGQVPDKPAE